MEPDSGGDLVFHVHSDTIRHGKPRIYQAGAHGQRKIAGRYVLDGPLRIDPAFVAKLNPQGTALLYLTYMGGSDGDAAAL